MKALEHLPFHRASALLRSLVALSFIFGSAGQALAAEPVQRVVHMLDYIGVDYPAAVSNGRVVDAAEYAEQEELAQEVMAIVRDLPANAARQTLVDQANQLGALIRDQAPEGRIAAEAAALRDGLLSSYQVPVAPRQAPDIAAAATLFEHRCAACHGIQGRGDGPSATGLDPRPTNFHDASRQAHRNIYGLYNVITLGVDGTAMPGFSDLSDGDRWGLAFYVSRFMFTPQQQRDGQALWDSGLHKAGLRDLADLTLKTPQQAQTQQGDAGLAVLAYLRAHPQEVMAGTDPLRVAGQKLGASLSLYRQGDSEAAYQMALSAYLEGFELAESGLRAVDAPLVRQTEEAMMAYRNAVRTKLPTADVEAKAQRVQGLLAQARERLSTTQMSAATGFISAFVILLREGLEAILVLAVIGATLIKTGRRDALPYLHAGWVSALLLGFATWGFAGYVIEISGAGRELTEGVTALIAAGVLLYVGFWLHNKAHAQRWQRFIEGKIRNALTGSTLWTLAFVAFLAVYREVFETVLFYQALWLQAGPSSQLSLVLGLTAAGAALVLLTVLILRFSVRLPLRQLFNVNAIILFVLAVVFAGHGIAALQEAGKLPVDPVAFPRIDILGVYPTRETLVVQGLVLLLGMAALFYERRHRNRHA